MNHVETWFDRARSKATIRTHVRRILTKLDLACAAVPRTVMHELMERERS